VRVASESLDASGRVVSMTVTETRSTLIAATPDDFTLRVEVVLEVGGKRFPPQVQTVKHGYHGETADQKVTTKKVGDGEVVVNGKRIPCEIRQITISGEDAVRESKVSYSPTTPPYQLKRETTTATKTPGGEETTASSTVVDVVALELPHLVLGEIKTSAAVRTVHKHAKGTSVTLEAHCDDVPGGVVSHAASESDQAGHVIRRSTLELVDYSIGVGRVEEPSLIRRRKFHRNRQRRSDEMSAFPQR
jgi:hypothetical protein